MKRLAVITVAVALIGALTFLCLKVRKFSGQEHEQFQTTLWRLKHLDTTFKESILEARFALLDNYDDFQTLEEELALLVERLSQTPAFIHPADRAAIEQVRAQYAVLSEERNKLFERFKSRNAMLANSRRYLPGALDELAARLQEGSTNRELQEILGDVTRLTLLRLSSPDELPAEAPARLLRLKQWAASHPKDPESTFVLSLLRHAQNIVAGNGELDTLTRQLLTLPTAASIEKLFQTYGTEVAKALHKAQQYRIFLYVLGLITVLGVAYTLWALRSANRNLERRVTERTRELAGSEERFRMLSASAPIGIFLTDGAGRALYTNPHWQDIAGLTLEESLGEGWVQSIHPDDAAAVIARWEQASRAGTEFDCDFRMRTKTGEVRWVHSQSASIRSEKGEITGHVGTVENITERRGAEEKLRDSQLLLQSTLNALSAHIAILDETGVIIAVNSVWKRFAEQNNFKDPSFGVGSNYLRVCEPALGDCSEESRLVAAGIRALMTNQRGEFQLEYPCHSPSEDRWFLVRVTRFCGDGPVRVVVAHENITQRKHAEAELQAAHKQLIDTSRQAGMAEVATSVLHNVGNVLNSVNVSSTLIADAVRKSKAPNLAKAVKLLRAHEANLGTFLTSDPKGKQLPEYLAQLADHLAGEQATTLKELAGLHKNIEHIKDIVSKQQSYAVVSGVAETVEVSDLVEDALHLNAGSLTRHEVEAVREFADVPPISIDKHKVLQILVNLISNAKQACDDSGRADKRMTVRVTNGEGSVKIAVSDNGVGIPPENLICIFNHGFTTRKTGHGFGLHSGALAAKQLGGELRVQSDGVGHGATFTLELPLHTGTRNSTTSGGILQLAT